MVIEKTIAKTSTKKRRVANTVASRKGKASRAQNKIAMDLQNLYNVTYTDIRPVPLGTPGIDIWLSEAMREKYPYAQEIKNREKLNIWDALEQCEVNATKENLIPLLIFKRNNTPYYITLRWEMWVKIQHELLELKKYYKLVNVNMR